MNIAIMNVVGVEGSTGKIATKLAKRFISLGHKCIVFHGRGKNCKDGVHIKHGFYFDNVVHYLIAKHTGKEGYYSTYFTKQILNDLVLFNPDRVIILNLHGHWLNIPLFLNEISKLDVHIDWLMCDEFPFTARCTYTSGCEKFRNRCMGCTRYKNIDSQYSEKEQYYKRILNKTLFSSVIYIVNRAKESSLLKNAEFDYKNPGIDTDFYHPVKSSGFRKKHAIAEDKIVLIDVAPLSNKRKGVYFFIEAARQLEKDKKYVFVNVGYDGKEPVNLPNFISIPYVLNQEELREIYSSADRYVCTSTEDALPNACVEAMSCGTPITAFNISGMPYLADPPVLELVKDVSVDSLVKTIKMIQKKDSLIAEESRRAAIAKYSFSDFADSIIR